VFVVNRKRRLAKKIFLLMRLERQEDYDSRRFEDRIQLQNRWRKARRELREVRLFGSNSDQDFSWCLKTVSLTARCFQSLGKYHPHSTRRFGCQPLAKHATARSLATAIHAPGTIGKS